MAEQDDKQGKDGSFGTVLVAGGANLAIAVAKLVAGALTGSSAMLAEGAHSVADTVNQVFLLTALTRSKKPADAQHPFGYGMERYFWSLLAAVGIFVLGAGFAAYEGIQALTGSGASGPACGPTSCSRCRSSSRGCRSPGVCGSCAATRATPIRDCAATCCTTPTRR